MRSIIIAALLASAFMTSAAQAGSCVNAGGQATMLTEDLAKFMAKAAMNNQIKNNGLKPAGRLTLKCAPAALGTSCTAHQRACK